MKFRALHWEEIVLWMSARPAFDKSQIANDCYLTVFKLPIFGTIRAVDQAREALAETVKLIALCTPKRVHRAKQPVCREWSAFLCRYFSIFLFSYFLWPNIYWYNSVCDSRHTKCNAHRGLPLNARISKFKRYPGLSSLSPTWWPTNQSRRNVCASG